MIITRKHLNRRTFLRGLGAGIALPLLDSMIPAFAAKGDAAPLRLGFVYMPNGIIMKDWTPRQLGANYEFTKTLQPMEPFRKDMLLLSGLEDHNGNELGDGGGDHARASGSYLTGIHPKKGADANMNISIDQVIAQSVGSKTRFPSLEYSLSYEPQAGACDGGYNCSMMNTLSWRNSTSPLTPESNPRTIFERLFGTGEVSVDPATQARRLRLRKSILDVVGEDAHDLSAELGAGDRRKLDEYLYGIREIEQRIEKAESESSKGSFDKQAPPNIEKPDGVPVEFAEYAKLMFDLQFLAYQADLTRVSTLIMCREQSNRAYPEIGIPDAHHSLSHHRGNPVWIEKCAQIDRFRMELVSHFIGKLKSTPDGDGSLLDHSMIVCSGGLSNADQHTHENLPTLLFGRANGKLKPGRHVGYYERNDEHSLTSYYDAPRGTPVTNLFVSLADMMGVKLDKFADSTGALNQLSDLG